MTVEEAIKGLKVLAKDFSGYKPNEDMFEMAIEALEKQIPIQVEYKQKQYGEYFYCPECRHTVKWIRDYEYCAYCGKAIEFPDLVSKDTNDLWLTEETLEGET